MDARPVIDAIYREGGPRTRTAQGLIGAVREALSTPSFPPAVPLGAHGNHADGSLVRLRCMVQDMHDPEFFPASYRPESGAGGGESAGMFRDVAPLGTVFDESFHTAMERLPCYAVPVPGETAWSRKGYYARHGFEEHTGTQQFGVLEGQGSGREGGGENGGLKRSRGDDDADEASTSTMMAEGDSDAPSSVRHRANNNDGGGASSAPASNETNASSGAAVAMDTRGEGDADAPLGFDLNFPVEGQRGPGVILKFYGEDATAVKLCDTIEVVGVISCAPELAGAFDHVSSSSAHPCVDADGVPLSAAAAGGVHPRHDTFGFEEETVTRHPPASLVPRVHVITVRRLGCLHPSLPPVGSAEREAAGRALMDPGKMVPMRTAVVDAIARHAMGGDTLAAEYALMHMLSRTRPGANGAVLGRLCVNFYSREHFSPERGAAAALAGIYEALLPASFVAPLTRENLDRGRFSPGKCYRRNRLNSGMLQLPAGGCVIVDETRLSQGPIGEKGVAQLGAIARFLLTSEVRYDFGFHNADLPATATAAVVSEARSKVLQCDVPVRVVPLSPVAPTASERSGVAASLGGEAGLDQVRKMIALVRHADPGIPDDLAAVIKEEYVAARARDAKAVTGETLSRWINLAKLRAQSFGEATVSRQRWDEVLGLEREREARVNQQ